MENPNYEQVVTQHIEDCKVLNLPDSELAFSIIHSAETFQDEEVRKTIVTLPENILVEIKSAVSDYESTGEYYVVSSTGVTKNLSNLMKRISFMV